MLVVGSTAVMVFECSGIEMKLLKVYIWRVRVLIYAANLFIVIFTLRWRVLHTFKRGNGPPAPYFCCF